MIAWTLEAALESGVLDHLIVSTDDDEIADVSIRSGAEVPFRRPVDLAQNDTPHLAVILHAVEWMEREKSWRPEYVMVLQPTSPLRMVEDIRGAINLALDRCSDGVVSVSPAASHPYLTVRIAEDGTLTPACDGARSRLDLRRQDLPDVYVLNGAIFLTRREVLLEQKTFYPPRTLPFVMPVERSLDIDTPWDLHVADLVLEHRRALSRR